ncbi:DUF1905 domain-containing protein [Microbacterium sp. NC79]|uniref:DUF1905 domain-containing protein n=1 Tax=Microbacterium sp. NC79 TaxID=2851009 RepID=UPI001C2BF78A|nr:DUF1905 domain-containing protein [Microbacterium sp. NC79]MBV0895134.1 DUF1905 domain-containing protein [Microbacterium sp. NC79]
MRIEFESPLWLWEAKAEAWTFVTVPTELSDMIREIPRAPRGFGSVRVRAHLGDQEWSTSIFPSKQERGYILPIKRAIRETAGIAVGDVCSIHLDVIDG